MGTGTLGVGVGIGVGVGVGVGVAAGCANPAGFRFARSNPRGATELGGAPTS